jgi:hypothetical protein
VSPLRAPSAPSWRPFLSVQGGSHTLAHSRSANYSLGIKGSERGPGGRGRRRRGRVSGWTTSILPDVQDTGSYPAPQDSLRTQICILGCRIATGRRASRAEALACPWAAGYSRQSQNSVQGNPHDLAMNMVTGGRKGKDKKIAPSHFPLWPRPLKSIWDQPVSHHPYQLHQLPPPGPDTGLLSRGPSDLGGSFCFQCPLLLAFLQLSLYTDSPRKARSSCDRSLTQPHTAPR